MPLIKREYEIKARDFSRAGEGAIKIKNTLKSLGFEGDILRRASICAYESEMNVVMHGSDGTLTLTVDQDQIMIEVQDKGPGIEDMDLAFQEGWSTASDQDREIGFGAGMGLPNIKKNADSIKVESEKGKGTYLKMCFRSDGDGK